MDRLNSKITFTNKDTAEEIIFTFVNSVVIKSSYETLTDTARIIVPQKLTFQGVPITTGVTTLFNRGDSVKIELGYFPNIRTVFEGFIAKVSPKTPLVIDCEDSMFLLKQDTVTNSFTNASLEAVLKDIIPEGIVVKNIAKVPELGKLRYSRVTPAKVPTPVLRVGLASDASDTNTETFIFEERVIRDELDFQTSDDIQYRVTCISLDTKTNAKVEANAGDAEGQQQTFHYQNLTLAECQAHADNLVTELKYTGFRGTFTTFGEPFIRHGDTAKLISSKYPEKDGEYLTVDITRSFGVAGYRQEIELGIRLDI